jgi:hypothetical protein
MAITRRERGKTNRETYAEKERLGSGDGGPSNTMCASSWRLAAAAIRYALARPRGIFRLLDFDLRVSVN